MTSSDDQDETRVPMIVVSTAVDGARLESTETLDDVDEDEAFISELMAMHPNDEDIVVEDLEVEINDIYNGDVHVAEEAIENVVRQKFMNGFSSIALSC